MIARRIAVLSLLVVGCMPAAAPSQRPPTSTLEQGEVLRLVAELSTPVLRAPDTPLEVLEARYAQAGPEARPQLAGDLIRGRVAALEGLLERRVTLEARAADAAAERARASQVQAPRGAVSAEAEDEDGADAAVAGESHRDDEMADRALRDRTRRDRAQRDRGDGAWSGDEEGWGEDTWAEPDGDADDSWGESEEQDDWEEDDGWDDDDDDWEEDDGWGRKKRRRGVRRRDRRARRDLARRRRRRAAARPAPRRAEPAVPEPAPAPQVGPTSGPAAELAQLDHQIARGRVSLERLASELPRTAVARAQADFAVVWIAWRTESEDAARRAEQFVETHPRASDLVALAWMLRAELTYEADASLSALRFGANRLGEPVYAYSLWRAATIQRESGDASAERESLLAVERAACASDAARIVRELGYAAAERLEHGVRRDADGILRPDTCPTGDSQNEEWRPAE